MELTSTKKDTKNSIKQNTTPRKKKKISLDNVELTLLALPTTIWYIIFCYLPMFGVIVAFKQYLPGKGGFIPSLIKSEWVGFKNFEYLFKTKDAYIMLRNTLLYNAVFIVLEILIPVTLAIMLASLLSKGLAKVCQTAMFMPHFLSWVVVSYFVFAFLSPDKGLLNNIIQTFGVEPINWYTEEKYWPYILTFMRIWKTVGYNTVFYLAAITGLDKSYYEAAIIDGASKWQQTRFITIPMLKPIIIIMFILAMGHIFNSDFGLFYQVPRGATGLLSNATMTIDVYVYNALKGTNDIGMSASAALFQSVFGCITVLATNIIVKKVDPDSGLF